MYAPLLCDTLILDPLYDHTIAALKGVLRHEVHALNICPRGHVPNGNNSIMVTELLLSKIRSIIGTGKGKRLHR